MMKKVFFVCCLVISFPVFAQYPGGVNTNLKLWLKANSGVTLTGTTVTLWNELSGALVTGNFAAQGANIGMLAPQVPPTYQAAGVNFNPHVVFSTALVNSISSNNAFAGTQLIDPYNNTMLQVIKLHTMTGTGVWFKWQYNNTNVNRMGNEVNNGGTNTGKIRFDFRGVNNFSATVITDKYFLAGCNTTQAQSIIRLNGANDNVINYTTQAAFAAPATNPARITLGNEEYGDGYPTTIDIAEVIMYNRTLTAAERNKVESYLAVKYGFTLDQSATNANDYTSSIGTVIWNRTQNLPFINNITGIGRDDGDSLVQRQSRSVNTAGLVTIYHGGYNGNNFPVLNTTNTNNFTTDNTYLLFGDNGGTIALNRCVSGNPAFLRMNRSWKVQMTGTVSTVTLAVKASDVAANTKHLLVSTDSAFTGANTVAYRLDSFNNYLSRQIVLQNNTYFTFASDSLILKVSSNSPLCVGNTIQLNATATGASTFSWSGPAGFTSTAQNPTIPGAGSSTTGVYTVNASTNGCAFQPASVTVTVSPMPAPPVVVTPIIYCQNDVALPLTANGQNLTWYPNPTGGGGTTTPPIPSTAVEDTLTWWVTQSTNGCESIRTKADVHIRYRPNGIIRLSDTSICQNDVDTFYFQGNSRPGAMYDWKVPASSATILSGSGAGPIVIRFNAPGKIQVRLQVNNGGCVSDEMLKLVTVRPRPVAHIVLQNDACVDEKVRVGLNYSSLAISDDEWDWDGGTVLYGTYPGGPYGVQWHGEGQHIIYLTTTAVGCRSQITTDTVMVHPLPLANITRVSNNNICMGDSVLLEARQGDPADLFSWTPSYFFHDSMLPIMWAVISKTGYMGVHVTSKWGCKASDSVLITARPCCEVALPSAFTPNGDSRNDRFRIITVGHHEVGNFRVVNRWGQTVFETVNEDEGWDGTYNGVPQEIGTYYYFLRFRCNDGANNYIEQKGEVTLVR